MAILVALILGYFVARAVVAFMVKREHRRRLAGVRD